MEFCANQVTTSLSIDSHNIFQCEQLLSRAETILLNENTWKKAEYGFINMAIKSPDNHMDALIGKHYRREFVGLIAQAKNIISSIPEQYREDLQEQYNDITAKFSRKLQELKYVPNLLGRE